MPSENDLDRLRGLAADLVGEPSWAEFASYCDLRARGLRTPALEKLDRFLAAAEAWPFEARRRFIQTLCDRKGRVWDKRVLLPEPLVRRLVRPTLQEWAAAEATDPRPLYLAGLFHDGSLEAPSADGNFRAALAVNPRFEPALLALADLLVADVHFSQHHLPDGYIGDPTEDLAKLDEAESLIAKVTDAEAAAWRLKEIADHRREALICRDPSRVTRLPRRG